MNILFTTIGLLTMLTFLTLCRIERHMHHQLTDHAFQRFCRDENKVREFHTQQLWKDIEKHSLRKNIRNSQSQANHTVALRLDNAALTSKLDIGTLSPTGGAHPTSDGQKVYEFTARLLRYLYGNQDFFRSFPGVEYKILDGIYFALHPSQSPPGWPCEFAYPIHKTHHLTAVSFPDANTRDIYYKILTGWEGSPCLLQYIKLTGSNRRKALCLNRVPYELCVAVFGHEEPALDFVQMRSQMHQNGTYTSNRGTFTKNYINKEVWEDFVKKHHLFDVKEFFKISED